MNVVAEEDESEGQWMEDVTMKRTTLTEQEMEAVETELEQVGIVKAPDGHYGWVIVAAAFLANVIVDGIIFTAPDAFLVHWVSSYNTTTMAAAWTTSILAGSYLLVGPMASALSNFFGCRAVTIGGALIASAGFLLSYFAPALPFLYITFGIIGGIGFGLIYLPSIVIVSHYFHERRALATGLTVCGSGIGTSLFKHIFNHLLAHFAWKTVLLFIAAIVLLCIVSGLLFRSLEPSRDQVKEVAQIAVEIQHKMSSLEKLTATNKKSNNGQTVNGDTKDREKEKERKWRWDRQKSQISDREGQSEEVSAVADHQQHTHGASTTTSPHVAQGVQIERFVSPSQRKRRKRTRSERPFLSSLELRARERQSSLLHMPNSSNGDGQSQMDLAKVVSRECVAALNRPLSRMDVFYPGSIDNLLIPTSSRRYHQQPLTEEQTVRRVSTYALSTISLATPGTGRTGWCLNVSRTLQAMLDVQLLHSASFLLLALSGFLTLTCFFVPFAFLATQASLIGLSHHQQARLFDVLGITNIVARIFCGWLADRPQINALTISNTALILAGIATILVPHMNQFWMFLIYCVFFGFGVACFAALRSIICVELLGLHRLTSAYGFLLLFMGVAALLGTPIAGFLRDVTGNFTATFYVMGSLMTLSGLICIPLKLISQWEDKSVSAHNADTSDNGDRELQLLTN